MGVEHLMATCSGIELTGLPLPLNHQNAFPLIFKPHLQDGGGPTNDEDPETQIERLALWTSPIRAELGIDSSFADRNGAQRQRQLIEAGAPREEVFAAATEETRQTYAQEVRV